MGEAYKIHPPHCSDGGCVFGHPGGQHTNGGCRCLRNVGIHIRVRLKDQILALRSRAEVAETEGKYKARKCHNWRVLGRKDRTRAKGAEAEVKRLKTEEAQRFKALLDSIVQLRERAEKAETERDNFGEMLGPYEDKFKALRARLYEAKDLLKQVWRDPVCQRDDEWKTSMHKLFGAP